MSNAESKDLPAISNEFAHADLGDVRRTKRLQQVADRVERNPDAGFPQMVACDSEQGTEALSLPQRKVGQPASFFASHEGGSTIASFSHAAAVMSASHVA
jgi:hypothetical protein